MHVCDLVDALMRAYRLEGLSSLSTAKTHAKPILRHLGHLECDALGFEEIEEYKELRLDLGRTRKTINNELQILQRAFRLAAERQQLERIPPIMKFKKADIPRENFVTREEFRALVQEIRQPVVIDIAEFAFCSGWRKAAILGLEWSDVAEDVVRLRRKLSKNSQPWVLPLVGDVGRVVERRRRWRLEGCPFLFHRQGRQVRNFYAEWHTATKRAGLDGLRLHDLRRSFARNATNAGIDEKTIMRLGGWLTRAVFQRYNIRSENDLRAALNRLEEAGQSSLSPAKSS